MGLKLVFTKIDVPRYFISSLAPLLLLTVSLVSFESVANAQSNTTQSLQDVKQSISVPKSIASTVTNGKLDSKSRRTLAAMALQKYLFDYASSRYESGAPEGLEEWVIQVVKSRFRSYSPSWTVTMVDAKTAEVSLVVSMELFNADLQKSNYFQTSGTINTNSPSANSLAVTSLLLDEASLDLYVLPASDGLQNGSRGNGNFQILPGVQKSAAISRGDLNSTTLPLSERLGLYSNQAQKKLGEMKLTPDKLWTEEVLRYLNKANDARVKKKWTKEAWPPVFGFQNSTLINKDGVILFFSARNAEKSGILEKLDFVKIQGGKVSRFYWSRNLNDPLLKEEAGQAIDKAAAQFLKIHKSPATKAQTESLKILFDKRLTEKDLTLVEASVKSFSPSSQIVLTPFEVTREDVRYQTPLKPSFADAVVEKIKRDLPTVYVRALPGESGYVQISPAIK